MIKTKKLCGKFFITLLALHLLTFFMIIMCITGLLSLSSVIALAVSIDCCRNEHLTTLSLCFASLLSRTARWPHIYSHYCLHAIVLKNILGISACLLCEKKYNQFTVLHVCYLKKMTAKQSDFNCALLLILLRALPLYSGQLDGYISALITVLTAC